MIQFSAVCLLGSVIAFASFKAAEYTIAAVQHQMMIKARPYQVCYVDAAGQPLSIACSRERFECPIDCEHWRIGYAYSEHTRCVQRP